MAAEQGAPATKKRGASSRSVSPISPTAPIGSPSTQSDPGPAVATGSPHRMMGLRREAESPSAPTREMSSMELTHAYQHLAALAALDEGRVYGSLPEERRVVALLWSRDAWGELDLRALSEDLCDHSR